MSIDDEASASRGRSSWFEPRHLALVIGAAVFSMAVAAVATIGAGTSYLGEAVITFQQSGVSYTRGAGLENVQMLGGLAPTFTERVRSDEVLREVGAAVGTDDLSEVRNHVSAVALPDTLAIRLRVQYDDEDDARAAIDALLEATVVSIEGLDTGSTPSIEIDVLRAPDTSDNRPDVARSLAIAAIVGLLLGLVAVSVLTRA